MQRAMDEPYNNVKLALSGLGTRAMGQIGVWMLCRDVGPGKASNLLQTKG